MIICIGCEVEIDGEEYEVSGEGPFCYECRREHQCRSCWGRGDYSVMRDQYGRLDYIRGEPTGERATCDRCHGEGYRL